MYTNMELALSSGSNSQHGPSKASVQSLIRAFDLLEILAAAGGEASLTELAQASHLPAATTHRIMRTLAEGGYVHQGRSRRYSLGPSLIHLGERAGRMLGSRANPHLEALAKQTGETANLAILEGDAVVYIAQAASNHTMRMFTEVGRRFSPHSTGVGKALLSQLHDAEVRALLVRTGTPARTPNTITEPEGGAGRDSDHPRPWLCHRRRRTGIGSPLRRRTSHWCADHHSCLRVRAGLAPDP